MMYKTVSSSPLLEVRSFSKSYMSVKALQSVSFDLNAGEVHALVGENGAGKSTLLSCINGLVRHDAGEIFIEGNQVEISSPADAAKMHLAMVHQELVLCPNLSVMENIYLGNEPRLSVGRIDTERMLKNTQALLDELEVPLNPHRKVGELSLNEQQIVEICRALAGNPKVIVFDEPTASLDDGQAQHLLEIIAGLKKRNLGIIYVSHRLDEVLDISERVTVLRDGQAVTTLPTQELNEKRLVSLMVGRETIGKDEVFRSRKIGEPLLKLQKLGCGSLFDGVDLVLHKGEILGVAGLLGCQREALARSLFGLVPSNSGRIDLKGAPIKIDSPRDAIGAGIAFMSADRKGEGLVLDMSIADNTNLPSIDKRHSFEFVNKRRGDAVAKDLSKRLSIVTDTISKAVGKLSGGNQQKVVIAKWIARGSEIIIAEDPTRGVDVGAKLEIWRALQELADQGCGIILMTTELQEMMMVCDRILTMSRGQITGHFEREDFSMEGIAERFFV